MFLGTSRSPRPRLTSRSSPRPAPPPHPLIRDGATVYRHWGRDGALSLIIIYPPPLPLHTTLYHACFLNALCVFVSLPVAPALVWVSPTCTGPLIWLPLPNSSLVSDQVWLPLSAQNLLWLLRRKLCPQEKAQLSLWPRVSWPLPA